jgi:hypothetical protein
VCSSDLMTDESQSHLVVGDQLRLVGTAGTRRNRGAPHQVAKLPGALAKCGVPEGIF